jgi:hypothetical protein
VAAAVPLMLTDIPKDYDDGIPAAASCILRVALERSQLRYYSKVSTRIVQYSAIRGPILRKV